MFKNKVYMREGKKPNISHENKILKKRSDG